MLANAFICGLCFRLVFPLNVRTPSFAATHLFQHCNLVCMSQLSSWYRSIVWGSYYYSREKSFFSYSFHLMSPCLPSNWGTLFFLQGFCLLDSRDQWHRHKILDRQSLTHNFSIHCPGNLFLVVSTFLCHKVRKVRLFNKLKCLGAKFQLWHFIEEDFSISGKRKLLNELKPVVVTLRQQKRYVFSLGTPRLLKSTSSSRLAKSAMACRIHCISNIAALTDSPHACSQIRMFASLPFVIFQMPCKGHTAHTPIHGQTAQC